VNQRIYAPRGQIPRIETSVKTGGRAVLSQKYVIYGFSKDHLFCINNRKDFLKYKGKVKIKIDGSTFDKEFTDMERFFEAVENDKFDAVVNVEATTRSQSSRKESNSKKIYKVEQITKQKTFSDNDFKTEINLTQYITFNEDNGRKMLIQLYYWAEGMKRLIDAQNKARRFRNDYNRLKTEPHGSRENEETTLREAKAERNTAQKHYEELQESIPLSPGVSDFSFPTATHHWWYGLRELKEVSVEFK